MSKFSYRLALSYRGTNYSGWQIQDQGERTIQGELNRVLKKISKSEEIKSIASGRTDAGVHALRQVCRVDIPLQINPEALKKAINCQIPCDIRVLDVSACDSDFHPIYDSKYKEYKYLFTGDSPGVFARELIVYHPYSINLESINKACQLLVGEHDFQNYFCLGSDVKSTVRKIFYCEVTHNKASWPLPEHFVFTICGSGFLKQMVRLIMGSIWALGRGKLSFDEFQRSLREPFGRHLAPVAPPHGLYMAEVGFVETSERATVGS